MPVLRRPALWWTLTVSLLVLGTSTAGEATPKNGTTTEVALPAADTLMKVTASDAAVVLPWSATTTRTSVSSPAAAKGLPAGLISAIPGPMVSPEVALTFDDGPSRVFTPQVLAVLAARGATATFFMVGRSAQADPNEVRAVVAAGNAVGGHTWDHTRLPSLSEQAFAAQVDRTDQLLVTLTGRPLRCVRPPYGRYDRVVVERLATRGLATVLWDADPRDWSRPGVDAIVARVAAGLHPGAIIELHDGGGDRSQTVAALPAILDLIAARGYRTVPLCL